MPFSRHGAFLAGIAAFLGLCAGCQCTSGDHGLLAHLSPVYGSEQRIQPIAATQPNCGDASASASSEPIFNGAIVRMMRPTPSTGTPLVPERPAPTSGPGPALAPELSGVSEWRPIARTENDAPPASDPNVQRVRHPGDDPNVVRPTVEPNVVRSTVEPQQLPQVSTYHPTPAATVEKPIVSDKPIVTASHFGPARPIAVLPVPREFDKQAPPPYIVEVGDVLLISVKKSITGERQLIDGPHLVKPDGYVNLGTYGEVYVTGMTLEQIRDVVAIRLAELKIKGILPEDAVDPNAKPKELPASVLRREVAVDVLTYNSKWYYVIIDGGGYGQRIARIEFTGNETVLDAIAKIGGLPPESSTKNIWIARATPADCTKPMILPVDWRGITKAGFSRTNYQVYPNDRIFVKADPLIATDIGISKIVSPVERLFGVTLLGSSTINSIKNGGRNGNGSNVP
jgi:polysaccharide export outer membrane protein